jgi:hypothetical protein
MTFEAARYNHSTVPGQVNRVVIGRLSIEQAEMMARETLRFIEQWRAQQTASAQSPTTFIQ